MRSHFGACLRDQAAGLGFGAGQADDGRTKCTARHVAHSVSLRCEGIMVGAKAADDRDAVLRQG